MQIMRDNFYQRNVSKLKFGFLSAFLQSYISSIGTLGSLYNIRLYRFIISILDDYKKYCFGMFDFQLQGVDTTAFIGVNYFMVCNDIWA
jgi:hypothetical protein